MSGIDRQIELAPENEEIRELIPFSGRLDDSQRTYVLEQGDWIQRNRDDLDSMLGSSDFLRWIYTVARNLSFNHLRHMRYEPKQSLNQLVNINDDSQEALENLIADDRCRMPDEEVEKAEFLSIVWESLNRLSNDYRRVVELCCIEGFSYRQAAVALNTRESVVAHNLMRARRKLSSTVEF